MPASGVPYAGETIEVTAHVALSGGQVVREADAGEVRFEFWAPGRGTDEPPDHELPGAWDAKARGFTCWADTEGWVSGRWTVRGKVTVQADRGVAKGMSDPFPLLLR